MPTTCLLDIPIDNQTYIFAGETGDEANKLAHTGFCVDETENVGCRDNPEYMRAAREKWVHVTGQTQCMVLENQENKRGYIKPAATQDMPEVRCCLV